MAPEIPGQFQFEHLLSHTFPGFFSAVTVFMLVDVLSPRDLSSYITKSVDGLFGFFGFVILIGTIIGVVIDGIHHAIIEQHIFNNFMGFREIREFLHALYPKTDINIMRSYFFTVNRALEIDEYIEIKSYRYSEFYSNTFIALIPFSAVAPFYLFYIFQISWSYSLLLGLITFFVACSSLNESYSVYKDYFGRNISALCGYLNYNSYVHVEPVKNYGNSNSEIKLEATIFDKKSQIPLSKKGSFNFKTTLGNFKTASGKPTPEITIPINSSGKAEVTLIFNQYCINNGIAIVTATSKDCIPGVSKAPKDKRVCISPHIYLKKKLCLTITNIILVSAIAVAAKEIFGLNFWDSAIIFLAGISIGTVICCLVKDYLVDENVDENLSIIEKIRKCLSQNAFGITMTFLITLFFALATLYFHNPNILLCTYRCS